MRGLHFKPHPHHVHINFLLIITILLIVFLLILIRPALLGYKISKQIEEIGIKPDEFLISIDTIKSKLLVSEANLKTCKDLNENLMGELSFEKNNSFKCEQEKNMLKSEFDFNITRTKSEFEQRKNEVEAELNRNKLVVEKAVEDYNKLVENAANNICCKARVDDKRIDSYLVSNNMIVCTAGEEKKISC